MSRDIIVVGAGHNGLTAAAWLAARGRDVLVLERSDTAGGLAAGHEFHSGYRSASVLHDTSGVRPWVVQGLGLEGHGLRMRDQRPDLLVLGSPGTSLLLRGDVTAARAEIARAHAGDAAAWDGYRAFLSSVRGALLDFIDRPPLDLVELDSNRLTELLPRALRLRRLGSSRMLEMLRVAPMCVADWLDEWFAGDLLKAALALPAVEASSAGPRSPGTNANLLLWEAAAGPGVEGGATALVAALMRCATSHGVDVRTDATVEKVVIEDRAARGVVLHGGERIDARRVVLSCDPRTALLDLVAPEHLSRRLEHDARCFRTRGTTAQLLLALRRPPEFAALDGADVEFVRCAGSLDDLERAHDAIKYREASAVPVLDIHVASHGTAALAPEGHAVLSALVHFAPYDREPGWDDEARTALARRALEALEPHAPGLTDSVVAHSVLTPVDLERRYGIQGGHLHHGEHALDQRLVRPVPGCIGYATPIRGLHLCGSGSHPGGGLTCGPGALAAAAIARGLDRE